MAVESDRERHRVVLPRVGDRLPDDLLMPEMHAVKYADGQADLAVTIAQFICRADNFHKFSATKYHR